MLLLGTLGGTGSKTTTTAMRSKGYQGYLSSGGQTSPIDAVTPPTKLLQIYTPSNFSRISLRYCYWLVFMMMFVFCPLRDPRVPRARPRSRIRQRELRPYGMTRSSWLLLTAQARLTSWLEPEVRAWTMQGPQLSLASLVMRMIL